MSFDDVADLIKIIDASACDELILETSELKLTVRRRSPGTIANLDGPRPTPASAAPQEVKLPDSETTRRPDTTKAPLPGGTRVRAPMVGTFYRAPSPDAPPFVEVGANITQGQPLCVIEVMKLFTTIYAETAGRVASIDAENGELVEFGRILFVIEDAV